MVHCLSVLTIAGYAGKDSYRKKRLFPWDEKVQSHINEIYAFKNKPVEMIANLIIDGKFDNG